MKIQDDFLDLKEFLEIQSNIMHGDFAWFFSDGIDFHGDNKFQLCHTLYASGQPTSPYFERINPILKKINPMSIWRIKVNLITKTSNIVENEFHVDMSGVSEERMQHWTTSIFYINSNDGYTEFEDGTKVESVKNRIISFPSNTKHRGTSCTNQKARIAINFNYFDNKEQDNDIN